jgi:TorA maturation chaperone TorD
LLEAVCVILGDALRPAASAPSAARIAPALRGDALAADDAADAEHETAVAADSG